jgi:hypothetical protein
MVLELLRVRFGSVRFVVKRLMLRLLIGKALVFYAGLIFRRLELP